MLLNWTIAPGLVDSRLRNLRHPSVVSGSLALFGGVSDRPRFSRELVLMADARFQSISNTFEPKRQHDHHDARDRGKYTDDADHH